MKKILVVGNGWSALAVVGFLRQQHCEVSWIQTPSNYLLMTHYALESHSGVDSWLELAEHFQLEWGIPQMGLFTREYYQRALRDPRIGAPASMLRSTEQAFFSSALECERSLRQVCSVSLEESVPLAGLDIQDGHLRGVILGSGTVIEADLLIYADSFKVLAGMQGVPKPLNMHPSIGALQLVCQHEAQELRRETFMAQIGDDFFCGYFAAGNESVWTLPLGEDDDNHQISKKLRKMKQVIAKMFPNTPIFAEQVRLIDEAFGVGKPQKAFFRPQGLWVLSDLYGPAHAFLEARSVAAAVSQAQTREAHKQLAQMRQPEVSSPLS